MSSAHDRRAHVRHDSIAYRRAAPSSPTKADSTQRRAQQQPQTPTSPVRATPSAGNDDEHKKQATTNSATTAQPTPAPPQPTSRASLLRSIAFCAALVVFLWHFLLRPASFDLDQLAHERKLKMDGVGESHVLPKRWRAFDLDNNNATRAASPAYGTEEKQKTMAAAAGLPECKRVLLFKFSSVAGFSSEINLYLQASVIATKLGFTLLADDSDWNFGHLRAFFVPRTIYCRPPRDWFLTSTAVPLGSKRWTMADRVWYGRQLGQAGDEWLRQEVLDNRDMDELRGKQFGHVLPPGQTLQASLTEVFDDYVAAIKDVWRPNDELANLIQKQRMELGLGADKLLRHRKHSPTWGGSRRQGQQDLGEEPDQDASQDGTDDEDERDDEIEPEAGGAAKLDRGPIIAVQLGASDDAAKSRAGGVDKGRFLLQSRTTEGIDDAIKRLTSSSTEEPSFSRSQSLFPTSSKPLIVMLTPNTTHIPTLNWSDDLNRPLRIERTSRPPLQDLRRWNDILRLELTSSMTAMKPFSSTDSDEKQRRIVDEWNFETFLALPSSLRTLLTLYFVRDLTTMSWFSDAFVVHASTNTGRLACVLSGTDALVGPRDISGAGLGGRTRSVDGYWYPSTELEGLWENS
ncbi:hypothetical protein OIV83_001040 [Microbotryomycetes sp. JL201]|nr:hypothetical protein OIV83_001040 [Microbotryomycetes sp. JL201]